jgi:flavin reductase (DIM6/NTAB) family NADH-FMN oxidoreductase RutF
MFYEPSKRNHGLPFDPFKAIVAPRPIGWISSISLRGEINLAPYSFFNGVSSDPPIVMFSSEGRKDSLTFVEETREFVCNLATWHLRHQVNATAGPFPRGVNEMLQAGLDSLPSMLVKPPRVKESPCALECKWLQTVHVRDIDGKATHRYVVFGQVVGIHIDEEYIKDGLLDTASMRPIARAGYHEYFVSTPDTCFSMRRPTGGGGDQLE